MGNWQTGEVNRAASGEATAADHSTPTNLLEEAHQALGGAVQFVEHHPVATGAALLAGSVMLGGCGKLLSSLRGSAAAEEAAAGFASTGSNLDRALWSRLDDFGSSTPNLTRPAYDELVVGDVPHLPRELLYKPGVIDVGYEAASPVPGFDWVKAATGIGAKGKAAFQNSDDVVAAIRRWGAEANYEFPEA